MGAGRVAVAAGAVALVAVAAIAVIEQPSLSEVHRHAEAIEQERMARPGLDLGEFEARCRPLVPILHDAWRHHAAHWEAFFPAFVWQMVLESSCRPDVVNPIDAAGLFQLLASAAADCHGGGLDGSRRDAIFNAECAAWLQARAGRLWRSRRTDTCRVVLVWIGHLTGPGHLVRSQKVARARGESAVCWNDGIGRHLHDVISDENAEHAHWYARWISDRSGIAIAMTHYEED